MDMGMRQAITTVINALKSGGVTQASIARVSGVSRPQLNTYLRQNGSLPAAKLAMVAGALLTEVERLSVNSGEKPLVDYKTILASEVSVLTQYVEQPDKLPIKVRTAKQCGTLFLTDLPDMDVLPLIRAVVDAEVSSISIGTLVKLQEIRARLKEDLTPELVKALLERM